MTDGGYTQTEAWNLQLQARVDRLEAALQKIIDYADLTEWQTEDGKTPLDVMTCKEIAVAALKAKENHDD